MIKYFFTPKADFLAIRITDSEETDVVVKDGVKTIEIGAGPKEKMTHRKLMLLARKVIVTAKTHKIAKIAINVADFRYSHLTYTPQALGELLAVNFEMANYEFSQYKTTGKDKKVFVTDICVEGSGDGVKTGMERGAIIGDEVNASRSLANTPGGDMTPKKLAGEIKKAIGKLPIKLEVLGKKQMEKLGMGAILGVASGSSEEPQFVIMEYWGAGRNSLRLPLINKRESKTPSPLSIRGIEGVGPIVLVGKGITFDSGGLNIKPGDYMNDMHLDMSGGAAVAHALIAIAKLKVKRNIVVLVPVVENMPSGSSYRPGDVLKSLSGQTIEIGNTDAEGRVILADALTYAHRYKAKLVVDVATLTGAAEVALGQRASAIFGTDEITVKKIQDFGEQSGDFVWPLPMWEEYDEEIKGTFGDWSNTGKTRWGGAIHGAVFLKQFALSGPTAGPDQSVGSLNWIHIDMAPRMLAVEGEHLAKGSAGAPVRLLVKILETL